MQRFLIIYFSTLFVLDTYCLQRFFRNLWKKGRLCDWKIAKSPLKSRLFKFKSHPHIVFGVWHLSKLYYEKWVQKSPEALWHLGFFGWHPNWMHNMVAEVGFEPHDLRVMRNCSCLQCHLILYHRICRSLIFQGLRAGQFLSCAIQYQRISWRLVSALVSKAFSTITQRRQNIRWVLIR